MRNLDTAHPLSDTYVCSWYLDSSCGAIGSRAARMQEPATASEVCEKLV